MHLKTGRGELKEIAGKDLHALYEIFHDEEVERFLAGFVSLAPTEEALGELIVSFGEMWQKKLAGIWGIYFEDNSFKEGEMKLIGFIGLMDLPVAPSLFYALHKDYRGKGLAQESVEIFCKSAINSGLCERIQTEVNIKNHPSLELLKKTGFKIISEEKKMTIDGNKCILIFTKKTLELTFLLRIMQNLV